MKTNIEINRLSRAPIGHRLVKKLAGIVIEGEVNASDERNVELSIVFVGPKKIREINKRYRDIDRVTDVLSFAESEEASGMPCRILGELVICNDQVKKNAKEAGVSIAGELAWVVVHGVLHLFGYDHENDSKQAQIMRKKEEFYLSKYKVL